MGQITDPLTGQVTLTGEVEKKQSFWDSVGDLINEIIDVQPSTVVKPKTKFDPLVFPDTYLKAPSSTKKKEEKGVPAKKKPIPVDNEPIALRNPKKTDKPVTKEDNWPWWLLLILGGGTWYMTRKKK